MTQPFVPLGRFKFGEYYRHSGQINAPGLLVALLGGLIAGAVLAGVYAAAVIFIPFIKLTFLICLFYGIALGAVPAFLLQKLKVRNLPMSIGVVLLVTVVSYYLAWVSWEGILGRNEEDFPSTATLISHPQWVYEIATNINEHGTWAMTEHEEPMKGTSLLVIWLIEAGLIVGASSMTVPHFIGKLPYCEKCDQWCIGPKVVRRTAMVNESTLKSKLESGDFAYVATIPPAQGITGLEFQQHQCGTCKQLNTLSVVYRAITTDKKGNAKGTKARTIVNKLLVRDEDLKKMMPATPVVSAAALPPVTG